MHDESARARVGILGGTFNPPHVGHVAVARHALAQLDLDRVVLMPAGSPPHKPAGVDPGPEHRLRMCELAVAGERGLSACALEVERGGPSYTVDTLSEMRERDPAGELTFIVGADTAMTLGSWRAPRRLLSLARLAVAAREGSADRRGVLDTVAAVAGIPAGERGGPRVAFLEMPEVDASSSQVRERAARAEPLKGLVAPRVADYIREHELYASAHTTAAVGG